jgi:hypothetical protein
MTDDPAPRSLPLQDLAQLKAQQAASTARNRKLIAQLRELQARTASVRAENARLRGEVCLLRAILRKVDRFP